MMLCVDSSGLRVQFSLADTAGVELGSVQAELRSELSRDLTALYDKLHAQVGPDRPLELSAIYAGQGPGAFIGTRVALSFVNGLAAAGMIPMYAFDSLTAMRLCVQDESAIVVRDARRGQFYVNDASGSRLLDEAGLAVLVADAQHIVSDTVPEVLQADRSLVKLQDLLSHCPGRLSWLERVPVSAMLGAASANQHDYIEPVYLRGYL